MIICDTNIIIEFYKGNQVIIQSLRNIGLNNIALSSISVGELIYGALNNQELKIIMNGISQLHVLPVTKEISTEFINLMQQYALSHKLTIPDALIASTALITGFEIYTLNLKDFRYIPRLNMYKS